MLFRFPEGGVSLEQHDFRCEEAVDWSEAFQEDALQVCLNFRGGGEVRHASAGVLSVLPQTVLRQAGDRGEWKAERQREQHHHFLTLRMSRDWVSDVFRGNEQNLCQEAQDFLGGAERRSCTTNLSLARNLQAIGEQLTTPPVAGAGARLWYQAKVLEIASQTLWQPTEDLFCQRQQRLARERTECVKRALARDLEYPPTLAELGREAGCSAAYLSRTFAEQAGMTITRYLRTLRLERAAELLRSGEYNVTEAAMAVGYSSLSHFSKAFTEMFGACPCAFGLPQSLGRKGM